MSHDRPDDMRDTSGFYDGLATHADFARLADPAVYAAVPDDWWLGLADIVDSTEAIGEGRYKAVNTAAAAVIAAVSNALPGRQIPFVFGGDGASFAVGPHEAAASRQALAGVAVWIEANFGLTMRVAMLPVTTIRREGLDLRLARFAVSADLSYAMFSGGGLAWAEARMKAGHFAVPPPPRYARPDLSGLSCRFSEIRSRRGLILSLIVVPSAGQDQDGTLFGKVVADLLDIVAADERAGSPAPVGGPTIASTRAGYLSEVRTSGARTGRSFLSSALSVGIRSTLAYLTFRSGRKVGDFDPRRYLEELAANSDFRKFDDGLRMTLDCSQETADRIEAVLATAARRGGVLFGCHRQPDALMTCFVPSAARSDHVHFVDGASGGYAMAAQALKAMRAACSEGNTSLKVS